MPRHFTHFWFSDRLIENAAYAVASIVKLYPDAYLLGAFGADLFAEKEYKARLEEADPLQLFEATAQHIYQNASKCQLSYMLGFTAHYALDRAATPFVRYFSENGVNGYFGGKTEFPTSSEIEIGIDRHIIRDYLGQEKALGLVDDLKIRKTSLEEIASLYMEVINDVADVYMNDRKTMALLESARADIPLSEGLGRLDFMNREHREWRAYTGEVTALSFDAPMQTETRIISSP